MTLKSERSEDLSIPRSSNWRLTLLLVIYQTRGYPAFPYSRVDCSKTARDKESVIDRKL